VNTATITVPVTTAGTFTYQLVSVQESSATACVNAQTASITVTVNALPTVNITPGGTTTFCADGSVTLTSTTGNSYLWSTGATTQSINVSNQGNYSVTMTDGNGCTNSSSVTTVTVNPLPTATIARSTAAVCVNGIAPTVTLTGIGGTAPYTFVYTVNGGVNQTITSTVNTATITVPVTSAGTFTYQLVSVQESSATACVNVQTASTVVSVNPLPIATITPSGSTAFCAGGSVTLNANSGTGLSYAWTNGGTSNSRIYNTAGSYTVTVTDGNGCSNTSAPTVVSVNTLPLATITASSSTTFCAGSSVTLNANSGTGLSYAWTNGGTSNSRTYNTAGSYTVTVTDGNGCSNTSAPTVITVNPLPTATITPNGPLTFCAGNSVNLTASNAVSYLWSNGATTNTISNITNSGTFSVSITDANGCSNTAAPVVVTVNALPTLNITNPAPVCSPGTVNLTAAAITTGSSTGLQLSYWSNANATTALAAPSSVGTSGTYYIRAIETVNNCSVIRPVTVAILPQAAMVVNTPAAVCAPNTIDITAAAVTNGSTAGLTYTYFTDALGTVTLNNANAIAQSGTYYIKGTPTTGCSAVVPVQVIINPPPVLVVNNPTAVCAPSLIDLTRNEITAGSENNLRFNYFIDAALNAEIGNPAQINNSGTYYIRATSNVTGCRSSLPVTVTVNPIPSGQLQTPPVNFICENGTLTLTASGSANYQWLRNGQTIPGATTASYDAATAGTYTVRFISAQGCARQASENIVLELLSQPIVDFAVTNTCVGVSASFQNRSQTNNAGGINWLWEFGDGSSSNQFSTQYAYITPGVYQVRLTASNPSCAVSASKTMEYIVRTAARSVRYPDVETLRGVAVAVNARSNIGNQYLWSPVAGVNQPTIASPIITVNETTLYTVSITSDIGCVTTDTVLIKIIPGTDIFVPQGFTPNNDGQNDRLFPILVGMRQLNYFKVFNRWGNMIFSTNSATPAEGWNGVYLGAAQPTGAYTWIAEAVDLQGRVVRRTGTVMLLR
jgi:large repetitive protein